jgi:hypothetical protein
MRNFQHSVTPVEKRAHTRHAGSLAAQKHTLLESMQGRRVKDARDKKHPASQRALVFIPLSYTQIEGLLYFIKLQLHGLIFYKLQLARARDKKISTASLVRPVSEPVDARRHSQISLGGHSRSSVVSLPDRTMLSFAIVPGASFRSTLEVCFNLLMIGCNLCLIS